MLTKTIDKFCFCVTGGTFFTVVNVIFGKMDYSLIVLLIAMGIDFITGILCGMQTSTLSSKRCSEGLFKKLMILLYVILAHHFDVLLHLDYVRISICYMYIVSETISIIENGVKLGAPVPKPIEKILEILNNDSEDMEE